jgi:TldD protein
MTLTGWWTRRSWLMRTGAAVLVGRVPRGRLHHRGLEAPPGSREPVGRAAAHRDLPSWPALAQQAVEAAHRAGAQYADVRLTRTRLERDRFNVPAVPRYTETLGLGVRALVDGYWGFAACPPGEVAVPAGAVTQVAQAAVAQARANATGGTPRTVELGHSPAITGHWATPVQVDPFTVSPEEKGHYIQYWLQWAQEQGIGVDTLSSYLNFMRQERVVATSDGTLVTQTLFESGGTITCQWAPPGSGPLFLNLQGLAPIGKGWELFVTDARIPEQLTGMRDRFQALLADQRGARPFTIGRYTLVCDGATMASLVGETLGLATQLDRALGYEANAGGTSFLEDPLGMVGHSPVAAPPVTVTANRSAPMQLATLGWDDEGVAPQPFTLIKDGVLVDFQTTREQAAWLAPYYQAHGQPVRSHGCAFAQDALGYPLQQRPNLALAPNPQAVHLADLVADVADGILVEQGTALEVDFQARTGLLAVTAQQGTLHKITHGRVGSRLQGGAVQFDTLDLFKHVVAVGGAATAAVVSHTPYDMSLLQMMALLTGHGKGQPPQDTSYSVQGVAATITNQPLIDPTRKA